jgi:hypothetical protein
MFIRGLGKNDPFMSLSIILLLLRIIGPVVDLQVRGEPVKKMIRKEFFSSKGQNRCGFG